MLDLIERIEAAEGPDRALDCLIDANAPNGSFHESLTYAEAERIAEEFPYIDTETGEQTFVSGADNTGIPRYTASLDAAMMLVDLDQGSGGMGHAYFPTIERVTHDLGGTYRWVATIARIFDRWYAEAATPALALTAAALKARRQSK